MFADTDCVVENARRGPWTGRESAGTILRRVEEELLDNMVMNFMATMVVVMVVLGEVVVVAWRAV
jgi:hypothetical protein